MTVIAIAQLLYQKDDKDPDSVVTIEPGEEVKGVPKEVVDVWKANGTVGDPPPVLASIVEEKDALKDRVAELEQQLADAKKPSSTPKNIVLPPSAKTA